MKKNIEKIILSIVILLLTTPISAQIFNKQKKTASYYNYETECLEDKLDGSFILQAWGKGSDKSEAIDQAKRNVLNDILFNGVQKGCQLLPLIVEVNAKTKYQNYTYRFFDKDYEDFIHIEKSPKSLNKSRKQTSYGIKVRVRREAIRQKLITDNIIKKRN